MKLIPKYQDGNLIYTARPSQYDFQVTAKAPTVYWNGFNWVGFNDLGLRVTKGSDFNPSGARIIENPQEFENARLAQARRKDINRTHEFAEKVRGVATLAAMAPMAGPLIEATTAVAPTAMPWVKGAMELGVRPTSTIVRGLSSYIPQVSKAVPYFTGLDKTAMGMAGLFGMKNAYEGYKSGDKHWGNALAEGALSGMMATELAPAIKYANEIAGRGFNFLNSPLTGKWTTFGNKQYRFKPGYLGMNGTPVESRNIVQEINISPEELYKILQNQKDYYFLGHGTGRTNVTPETIFNNGLRVKNGEISNTTTPISESNLANWPHLNSEEIIILPGKIGNVKYDAAHGHIPSDWYSNDVFQWTDNPEIIGHGLFATRKPNATFVETEINGVPGVYTKPEAVLGSYNTRTHTLRLNPKSQYKFSFSKTSNIPRITAENAVNITPEQWTAAQDAAIARGDMAEAQRLRDLHFKVSAPDTKVNTKVYHGNRTDNHIISFDKSRIGSEHKDVGLGGFWFIDDPEIAKWEYAFKPESWGKGIENAQFGEVIPAYINLKNPVQMEQLGLRMIKSPYGNYPSADESLVDLFNRAKSKGTGKDGFIFRLKDSDGNADPMYESIQNQFVVKNPNNIKSADAVTYNNGKRIPLGKRDNFNISDIRYGLLPWLLGGTTAGYLYNNKQ